MGNNRIGIVETILLLKQFHAEGKIAKAVADGVKIDDEFLLEVLEQRLTR